MFKLKKILILLILLIMLSFTIADESPLNLFGFNDIKLIGPNQKVCENIVLPENNTNKFGIISLKTEFIGEIGDNTYVLVSFNGDEQIIWTDNFNCLDKCVARIFVPKSTDPIETKICLNAGGKSISSQIFSNSFIGFYDTPVIEIEHISPQLIILDERAEMKIRLKNSGNKEADIFVQFLSENLREFLNITSFDIVQGDTSVKTTLLPNQEKEFIYYIKPTKVSSYNLPTAVVFFENIFGENQKISSNYPSLIVLDKEKVNLILISEELKENNFKFKLIIKNNRADNITGNLILLPNDLFFDNNVEINLRSFEEKEILFEINNLKSGNYSIMTQFLLNDNLFISNSLEFVIKEKDYFFEIIFSLIGIIISLLIFSWIYFQKS